MSAEGGMTGAGPGGGAHEATRAPSILVARRSARPLDPTARAFDLSRYPSLGPALADFTLAHRRNAFLVETDRERVVTQLDVRAFRLEVARAARVLAARGVGVDSRVAVLMSNGPRWLIGATAAIGLGAVLVPLDARADAPEQARLLAHCKARLLLVDGPVWRKLKDEPRPTELELVIVSAPLGEPGRAETWDAACEAAGGGDDWTPVARDRDAWATIVYSSGTTGGAEMNAKGCVLTHRAYLAQLEALATLYPLDEGDAYLSVLPTNHALDFMCGFLVPLVCGARVVHLRTLRPEWIARACKDHGVTHMSAVPALLTALERRVREGLEGQHDLVRRGLDGLVQLNAWLTRRRPNHALSSALNLPVHQALGGRLRRIFAGGAFVPRATARFLNDQGFPVAIGYGLTEACAVVTVNDLAPFRDDTVGLPLQGTELRIDGPGADGSGEVQVRGPQVFQGYLDDPERTAETFAPGGWLRTGDVGRLDAAGHLQLVGRRKHMVVTAGGKNVYPEEVEARFDGLPVEEHAVLAAHAVWPSRPGEDEALVLVVRPRPDGPDALALAERANRALPEHQRVQGVVLVDAAFPRTTSLKLRRESLAQAVAARGGRGDVRPLGRA